MKEKLQGLMYSVILSLTTALVYVFLNSLDIEKDNELLNQVITILSTELGANQKETIFKSIEQNGNTYIIKIEVK